MNREDIINLARKANACADGRLWLMYAEDLEIFFNLATAAEREACANVCMGRAISYRNETDPWAHEHVSEAETCAALIRARGQA